MAHYYTNETDLKSDIKKFEFDFKGNTLTFTSDAGVFSKNFIDFGSQVLLNAIEIKNECKTILDVGCGYGAMGVSLAYTYPDKQFDLVDVNLRAMDLCRLNAKNNNVNNVEVYESSVYSNVNKSFDLILSNPPIRAGKEVVHMILEEAYLHLNNLGELWIVIQKKQGAPSAKKKMEDVFGNVEVVKKDKGYYILKSVKNS